jgi:hypothetical protein
MISDPGVLVSSKIPDCALCQVLPRWVSQGRKRYVPSPGCLDGAKSNVEAFLAPLFASAVETRWLTCKFVPHLLASPGSISSPSHPVFSCSMLSKRGIYLSVSAGSFMFGASGQQQ